MKIYDWKKFLTFIAIVLLLIAVILLCFSKKKPQVVDVQEHIIQSGETLWSIASNYKPSCMSIQEYIYNLREFNKCDCLIYPNEVLQILIYEEV